MNAATTLNHGGRDLLHQYARFQALRPQHFTCVVNDVGYELMPPSFNVVVDYPLFNAGGSFSKQFGSIAMDRGSIVVDNSLTFRRDENVPLVSPELMADTSLGREKGL
ncbi:Aspartate-semialdehyde dehydrogenase [Actinidia chinensis var. chinensis]|uniref:Aspartate-semialdehyde dehydrogenase n=1 Tax=Actinidia chinensis var. chinensis TaxID=1590841 RepID=A0A2R6PGY7_ACTCC|nr:Aspartate-semialdehyde dehydrogenase [Actinidia chinensis var. chinensis]